MADTQGFLRGLLDDLTPRDVSSAVPKAPPVFPPAPPVPPAGSVPSSLPPPQPRTVGADGHRHRMRGRLLTAGPEALADHEMLEMLLFLALPRRDTKAIARALLARFGTFAATIAAPVPDLLSVKDLGPAGAAALKLAQAAAVRLLRAQATTQPVLSNWDALLDYLRATLAHETAEQVRVLYLDGRNRLLTDEVMGRGTVNHAPVYPREVAKRALEVNATALILAHNHPSGDSTPSREDIAMTRAIRQAIEALRITLHDHVVVSSSGIASFRALGLL